MAEPRIRCFIAAPLPGRIRNYLGKIQRQVDSHPKTQARFPRAQGLHITLSFLGDLDISKIEDVTSAMDDAAAWVSPFSLALDAFGTFPRNSAHAKVLWIGVDGEVHHLEQLYRRLRAGLASQGLRLDRHRFSPHITLARFKKSPPARFYKEIQAAACHIPAAPDFKVGDIHLYKSDLTPGGARYTCLYRRALKRRE